MLVGVSISRNNIKIIISIIFGTSGVSRAQQSLNFSHCLIITIVQLVVGGLILVPIRIIASLVLVSWYFVVVHFGLIGVNDLSKPITKWRRHVCYIFTK